MSSAPKVKVAVPLVSSSPPPLDRVEELNFDDDIALPYIEDFPRFSPESEDLPEVRTDRSDASDRVDPVRETKPETASERSDGSSKSEEIEDSNVEDLNLKCDEAVESYDLDFDDFAAFVVVPKAGSTADRTESSPFSDGTADDVSLSNGAEIESEGESKPSDVVSERSSEAVYPSSFSEIFEGPVESGRSTVGESSVERDAPAESVDDDEPDGLDDRLESLGENVFPERERCPVSSTEIVRSEFAEDDFGNFETFAGETAGDFGDFAFRESDPIVAVGAKDESVDFCNFASFPEPETLDSNLFAARPETTEVDDEKTDRSEESEDDDFGDFATADADVSPVLPGRDEKSESDACESIGGFVDGLFPEDVLDEEAEPADLRSNLGDVWSVLNAERADLLQWNDSTSQKKLLSALGIDSRNILFGSKWNPGMPRFAANLGASPLQPVKHGPTSHGESAREEEMPPPINSDPTGSECFVEQQASSYAESLLLDLENLMTTLDQMTSGHPRHFKISDLFNNACHDRVNSEDFKSPTIVARKINLPDTHIFTPENCETPWSHTIHYDDSYCNTDISNEPPISTETIHPKESTFDKINTPDNSLMAAKPIHVLNSNNLEDCDDFGEFHSSEVPPVKIDNILLPSKAIEATPTVPIINWPDPGNIDLSVFDELSQNDAPVEPVQQIDFKLPSKHEPAFDGNPVQFVLKETKIISEPNEHRSSISINGGFVEMKDELGQINSILPNRVLDSKNMTNDDFDDFQSAPYQAPTNKQNNASTIPSIPQTFTTSSILQPVKPSTEKLTGSYQILQPLSLESYSQINWPEPGVTLSELSNYNPVHSIQTYSENKSKQSHNITTEDDWSDFMSIKPTTSPKKDAISHQNKNVDEDDWTDFIGSAEQPANRIELKTISQNIHTQHYGGNGNVIPIPNLTYSTPRNQNRGMNKHSQNL